jgi:hypothetical protein
VMLTPKNIFLVDAAGALSSAAIIGLVLPNFYSEIGLPIQILYLLAALAFVYSVFSFTCFSLQQPKRALLLTIMLANLLYCVLTALIVVRHFHDMGNWGIFYFATEILIILLLVTVERNVYLKMARPSAHI